MIATSLGRSALPLLVAAVAASGMPAAVAHAEIVVRPATPRLGEPVALSLAGSDAGTDYDGYADALGRPCVHDQSRWQIGVVDPAVIPVFFGPDDRFTPTARSVRLCAYTLFRPEDGSTPVRTFLAERLLALPFTLPGGVAPVSVPDARGDALALRWSSTAASITRFTFACARKRFALTSRVRIGPDWTFTASGAARPDNSSDYDVPIPPRYGGHATLRVAGRITSGDRGSLRLVIRLHFRAPGLRATRGVPACRQGDRVFRTTFGL